MTDVLICSYLEEEHRQRIEAVDPTVRVTFEPSLIAEPRYACDHVGRRLERDTEQRRAWGERMRNADVLFDFDYSDPTSLLRDGAKVLWVQATSAGIGQFVAHHELQRSQAQFTTAAGVHARPLAEFALWGMLAFASEYPTARRQQRAGRWQRFARGEVEGKTLAVVGLGSIGRTVARLASAIGMRVIGSKRTIDGVDPASLFVERLFPSNEVVPMIAQADYVCLAVPHTKETVGLLDHEALQAMRSGSVLVNIGRGSLVDEEALVHALREGPLAGAVLDVAPVEPLPAEHPLWSMDNVIVFPHSASTSTRENERLTDLFCDNLGRLMRGEALRNHYVHEREY
ncbi:D-2-hydroxyacid dehydrogenase [soil metagenome]|nr:D-2-hydroxyacid dehydrogenase [Trueperaceae bacterium]